MRAGSLVSALVTYEYIRLALDSGDLAELNGLSGVGFRVVAVFVEGETNWALLERPLPPRDV